MLALLAIAAVTLYSLGASGVEQNKDFELWKAQHGKTYTVSEESYRIGVWLKNLEFVEAHNQRARAGLETYEVEMNSFADLSSEEFGAKYLIKYPLQKTTKCTGPQASTIDIPESIDWSTKETVTGVKNQGQCGSCWAFSTTGSLEGVHAIKTGELTSFSEQQLVDCSKDYGNAGCGGGLMNDSFFYVRDNGIATEAKFPYTGKVGHCTYNQSTDQAWIISDCTEVTVDSEKALLAAVAQNPVSVAIQANHLSFQLYKKGVYTGNCGTNLDHGVLAVGYGAEDSKDYFKVKNSWGGSWGQSGYIKIARIGDGHGKCGIQMAASFPNA